MIFTSKKNGTRDGEPFLISKDHSRELSLLKYGNSLLSIIEDWDDMLPNLNSDYKSMNNEPDLFKTFDFEKTDFHSPLPRTFQWLDASSYLNHVELSRKSRGAEVPDSFYKEPLIYQGCSDCFLGPRDSIPLGACDFGLDYEAEVAVIIKKSCQGLSKEEAKENIILLMLVNDISLREIIPNEIKKGFGFLNGKPHSSFSPFAITPDEIGDSWQSNKINLPLYSFVNGTEIGRPNAGTEMYYDFSQLICHSAKTRDLSAGTIIGSGTVSNSDIRTGSSCLVEKRMNEGLSQGEYNPELIKTSYLKTDDLVEIKMLDEFGKNIFGSIQQRVGV